MGGNLYVNGVFDIIVLQNIQSIQKRMCECVPVCVMIKNQCKLRKNQTLCRPNRAAFPSIPGGGRNIANFH